MSKFDYKILIYLLQILLFSLATAQNAGKLAGSVIEANSGEPIPGANVFISGTTLGAASDVDGVYFILNIPPGKYEVQSAMIGYNTVKMIEVVVNGGKTTKIDFELSEELLETETVVIVAKRPDVEKEKTSTSAIVRFDEVDKLPGIRDISDVLGLTSDVVDGHFRGGRDGEEYYLLQGMGIVNPLDRSSAFMPIMSGVEEVEIITSGFGAQYGNAQSGVVSISMKEGNRDIWKTRIESRSRAPGRKHFGPSAFDPNANEYLRLLMNEETWLGEDAGGDVTETFFRSMVGASSFAQDTVVQLAVAQALWRQTKRDIGKKYGQEVDFSHEIATGGPINDYLRMFIALRSNQENNIFPTEEPNSEYQAMGNVVAVLGSDMTLRLSGGLTNETENRFPGKNSLGFRNWMWDRISGIQLRKRINTQIGARFSHTLSPSTFYDIKLNTLFTDTKAGSPSFPDVLPDSIDYDWINGTLGWPNTRSPDGFRYQRGPDDFDNEKTRTISLDGSFTSQLNRYHLLNTGVQFNSYRINVSNLDNAVDPFREIQDYSANPLEGAFYIQDKMEFEGMIANIGLRYDIWYAGVDYYTDIYTPFGEPDSLGNYNPSTKKPPVYNKLQPRLGFSFPVSENTVFHLNYGAFMQRPSFQYIVSKEVTQRQNIPRYLGNPRLKPEITNSYDIGVVQGLGDGFTIDVSGYYKDVKNLIQEAAFIDEQSGSSVRSYFNLDYADIRGFKVMLNKRKGALTGSVNYQFSYATGKNATVNQLAATEFVRDREGNVRTVLDNVPTRDVLLDFDRTHNLVLTAAYETGEKWGPALLGSNPLANINLSGRSSIRSGRPYTSHDTPKKINEERSPLEYNTDLRITKSIDNFLGIPISFYAEVYNLFNNKILNYNYLFDRTASPVDENLPLQYYELHPINDKENGVRYWYNKGAQKEKFSADQSFLIYSNEPRSYSFGIVLEF